MKTACPSLPGKAKACSAVRRKTPAEQDRPFLREQANKFNELIFYWPRASIISWQEGMTSAPRNVTISVATAKPISGDTLVTPKFIGRMAW
jgi:hypothetical protein